MSQLTEQFVTLEDKLNDARQTLGLLQDIKAEIGRHMEMLTKSNKELRARAVDAAQDAQGAITALKKAINEAKNVENHIQAHHLWKAAVRSVCGPEKLQECFDWMAVEQGRAPELKSVANVD